MGDENSIRTLGDYSKPSHEGYKNTIELPKGNNVVPLRSDTIRLVQNGCSFHGLQSEDPNQHLKDFLKLVDSLDLNGSISTWEDLTTRFIAQFFPPRRTTKLRNDILMFQQHHGESISEAWTRPSPQPQALDTAFEARVRDYMMTEIFGILKELTTSKTPEKVLIREEAKFPVTKKVNSISLTKGERGSDRTKVTPENTEKPTETETKTLVTKVEEINEVENGDRTKSIKTSESEEAVEAPGSQPVAYYLKHKINEKLIKGLVNNNRFNNSRSRIQAGKKKGKEYKILPRGPAYDTILKKLITKKEDIGGNLEIPCSIGNLKHVNALVDQGSDINIMPYSTYTKLTDERPAETDIRLSLASHSYIYPLGIAKDVLV
ncbi:MAK10-like protein [Tanacetum coccineum]